MQARALDKLNREHTCMRSVLQIIGRQFDLLEQHAAADPVLLINALHYMRTFPGVVHHPKEELIFERLITLQTPYAQEIHELQEQHREIYRLEDYLLEQAVAIGQGQHDRIALLIEYGRRYLAIQHAHSVTEEKIVFPAALELFSAHDWRQLEQQADLIEDPLFGASVSEPYRALYDYLMREAEQD